jgi:hypothetical protein
MFAGEKLIPRITVLYQKIDSTYAAVAEKIDLTCKGCDGVMCCTVDLTLHTFIEMFYLRQGFHSLDPFMQSEILTKSRRMVSAKRQAPNGDDYRSAVCALNFAGACVLYEYRPMICRLAGIPHFFVRPDGSKLKSGGCKKFDETVPAKNTGPILDRTEFYREMAAMEIEAVRARGERTKKLTIAETLVSDVTKDFR